MANDKVPSGFSTAFHSYCDSCPNFEVEVSGGILISVGGETRGNWNVSCKYYDTCQSIKRHIQKEISDGTKDI